MKISYIPKINIVKKNVQLVKWYKFTNIEQNFSNKEFQCSLENPRSFNSYRKSEVIIGSGLIKLKDPQA